MSRGQFRQCHDGTDRGPHDDRGPRRHDWMEPGARWRGHCAGNGERPDRRRDDGGDRRVEQSGHGPQTKRDDRREREVRVPQSSSQFLSRLDRRTRLCALCERRQRAQRGPDRDRGAAGARWGDRDRGRGRARGGSRRARSDGAYRHRSEPHLEAADGVGRGRPEPGHHAGVPGRGVRLERVLSPDWRPRADAILD